MVSRAVRDWYEALRALERRAKAKPGYSRRNTARALHRDYGVKLNGQRISDWLRDDVGKAQIPRFSDPAIEEMVWALVRLWSSWAGDPNPDRAYWMNLLEAAQPAHARAAKAEGDLRPRIPAALARPAQLPPVPADFIGRVRELDEVRALCSPSGPGPVIVVVHGVAGVGKSALTAYLAHDLAAAYPDGQLFSRLQEDRRPLESGAMLARFLRTLGVSAADVPDDLASRAVLYRTLLAGRRMLILLDDAASEAQVRPLLPASDGCLILVTSRNPLPGLEGATTYRLDLLDQEEAERLLARIAGKERVETGEPASREVVNLCGRLPLAIRIAAARLRARTDWTVAYLAELLADASRRLRELRAGDLDVRAAFELSFRNLDDDAARLFRLLRVRPGPTFSAELAVEIAGKPVPEVEELLDRLILDQLVEPLGTPGRYGMHSLIWLFAAELLSPNDEQSRAIRAMNLWYAQKIMQVHAGLYRQALLVQPDDPCPFTAAEALAWLDNEEENLFRLLVQYEVTENDTLMAAGAPGIVVILRERGLWAERDWALDRGLAAARRVGNRTTQAMLLYERGEQLTGHQSAVTEALACWTEALALIDPAENPALAASLRDRIAHAYRALGRHADAEREMTAVAETIAAKDPEGAKLHLASFQAAELLAVGHPGQVIALLEPLIPVMERSAPETEVWDRLQLGKAYAHQQRYTQAVRQLLRCRRLCREYGVRRHEPEVLLELGIAYRGRGWQGRAREVWEEGLPKAETMANNEKAAVLAYELADDHQRQGDNRGAAELFARSAQAFEAASQHCNRANALDRLARVRLGMGDRDGAADAWARAIAGLDHADDQAEAEQIRRFLRKARAALLG